MELGGLPPTPSPRLARESWRGGAAPAAGSPDARGSPEADDPASALLCVACGARITDPSQAIAVEGTHRHVKTNPAGFTFEIGCFRRAPGAAPSGRPTAEHCWFAGYRWRFASCGACGAHLGWAFVGGSPGFFGLILDRLVPDAP